jgi:hypothetical protein
MVFNLKDLIKESVKLFEGRKEDALAKYGEVPKEIFDVFVENDPSGNHKYIDWLMRTWGQDNCGANGGYHNQYRCNNISNAESLVSDILFFNESPHKYDIKDINKFEYISQFTTATREARLILTKGELKKQATKLYETDRYLVIEPHSHPSSCYYGSGTQWCTTSKSYSGHFDSYYKDNSLLYFINKKTGKKRAFLTNLTRPMFGPTRYSRGNDNIDWLHAGDKEYRNYRGQIYTETDRLGRSFAGVPMEAKEAMQKGHINKAKKYAKNLKDSPDKIKLMQQLGMSDIPELTVINGSWNVSSDGPISPSVKEITGTFTVSNNSDFGNVEKVSTLDLTSNVTKVYSVKTCDTLRVQSIIKLNSLEGTIATVRLVSGVITDWGGVDFVDKLVSTTVQRGWKSMVNRVQIEKLVFTTNASKEFLQRAFGGKEVSVGNYY